MVDDGFEDFAFSSVLRVAKHLFVQRITNTVNIAVKRNACTVLRVGSTRHLIGICPLVAVVVVVCHQIRVNAINEVVGQAIAIGVQRCCSVVWEGIRTGRTDATNSVWTVTDTVAIGIGVGCVGSGVFSRGVVAAVVFSRVEQSVTVNVLIQCIADGIAIKVFGRGVGRLWIGETRCLIGIGGSIAVIV